MEQEKYRKLMNEIFSAMDEGKLSEAREYRKSAERVDAVQDLLRTAIINSSIGYFNGVPHYFAGRCYEPFSWDDLGNLVYDIMRRCELPNGDYSRVESVFRVCKRAVAGKELHPDNSIVVMRNCVYNIETRTQHDFDRRFVQMTAVDFDFNPDEYPLKWQQFLDVVLPDIEVQKVLQEFIGSIFIDRRTAKIEHMVILRGPGGNGKSVVFETLTGLLGRDNVSNFGIGALIAGGDKKHNLAFINGKRLNYCSEIQAGDLDKDTDALKKLISGERMEARLLYGNNFTAENIPLIMANANRLPYIRNSFYALGRRIVIIPFEQVIPECEQNKSLAKELEAEYAGIFNWILAGRERFISNGYKLTGLSVLRDAVDDYIAESSTVLQYMREKDYRCAIIDHKFEPKMMGASKLYNAYVKWCVENYHSPESFTKFGNVLKEAGYRKDKFREGIMYIIYSDSFRNTDPEYRGKGKSGLIRGVRELSHWTKISVSIINKMLMKGVLDGCYRKNGRQYEFELSKANKAMKDYMRSEKRRREVEAVPDDVKLVRRAFNERMKSLGEPYRKSQKDVPNRTDGIIVVPDEWDYDIEMGSKAKKHRLEQYKRKPKEKQ